MNRDDIRSGQHLRQLRFFTAAAFNGLRRAIGIIHLHMHAKALLGSMPHTAADGAKADEPQRAAVQFKAAAIFQHGAAAVRHKPDNILLRIQFQYVFLGRAQIPAASQRMGICGDAANEA